MDYAELANVNEHESLDDFSKSIKPDRIFAVSTKGKENYANIQYSENDAFLFGPETKGLPDTILDSTPPKQILRIPMLVNSRSLNLSNAVTALVYEAWRQHNFITGS